METKQLYGMPAFSSQMSASASDEGEAVSFVPGAAKVNILLAGGSRLLQEGVIQLLEHSQFSVVTCVEKLDDAIKRVREQPGTFQMMIVQLEDMNDAQFFDKLAQAKRNAGTLRIVILAWPTKALSFLAQSFQTGIDAYLESNTVSDSLLVW